MKKILLSIFICTIFILSINNISYSSALTSSLNNSIKNELMVQSKKHVADNQNTIDRKMHYYKMIDSFSIFKLSRV